MGRGGGGGGGFHGGGGGFRSSGSSFRSSSSRSSSSSSFRSSGSSSRGGSFGSSAGRSSGGGSFGRGSSSGRYSSGSHNVGRGPSGPSVPPPPPGGYYRRPSGSNWIFPYLIGRQAGRNEANRQQYYSNTNGSYQTVNAGGTAQSGSYQAPPQQQTRSGGSGCLKWVLIFLCVFFGLGLLGMLSESKNAEAPRTKLGGTSGYPIVIEDDFGILTEDKSSLKNDMEYFKDSTGVVPAVVTVDYDSFIDDAQANQIFDELGLNDSYFLLIYLVNQVQDEEDGYFYLTGAGAATVMDDDACDTFERYLMKYYDDLDLTYSEFIGESFRSTADSVMAEASDSGAIAIIVVLFLICLGALLWVISRERRLKKQEMELEKQKLDAEILNTPLEQFSATPDSTVEDLKKKYDQ